MMALPRAMASRVSRLRRCRASLRAVFRPMPGSRESSVTAFSSSDDEYSCSMTDDRGYAGAKVVIFLQSSARVGEVGFEIKVKKG